MKRNCSNKSHRGHPRPSMLRPSTRGNTDRDSDASRESQVSKRRQQPPHHKKLFYMTPPLNKVQNIFNKSEARGCACRINNPVNRSINGLSPDEEDEKDPKPLGQLLNQGRRNDTRHTSTPHSLSNQAIHRSIDHHRTKSGDTRTPKERHSKSDYCEQTRRPGLPAHVPEHTSKCYRNREHHHQRNESQKKCRKQNRTVLPTKISKKDHGVYRKNTDHGGQNNRSDHGQNTGRDEPLEGLSNRIPSNAAEI